MPSARFAVVTEYLISDMLLKPVGWFSPTPFYVFVANTDYTLDFVGSSASSSSVTVSTSAVTTPYPNVLLSATPTAKQLTFRTIASPSQIAFYFYATDINLTGVRLSYDLANVTFSRSPQRPVGSFDIIQARRASSGGAQFGFDQTITQQVIQLKLRLTTAEKDDLLTFFATTVNGMSDSFTYFDPTGAAVTVRFDSPRLTGLQEKAYDAWELTVALRVQP